MKTQQPKSQGDKNELRFSRWLFYRNRLRFAIFRRDSFRCKYCNRSIEEGAVLTLEHIIPLSKGGDYSADNLLTACHKCNQGKADAELTPAELKMLKNPTLLFADWPVVGWKAVAL